MPIARFPICVSIFALVTAIVTSCPVVATPPAGEMIELTLNGRRIEGTAIAWSQAAVDLLGRDGHLWEFAPHEATNYKKTSSSFAPYSPSEFRARLLREFGNDYEVNGTGHYLVTHPKGQRDRWAQRFEDLYRSFVHYFSVRGVRLDTPPFLLVGIVCRNQAEFVRIAQSRGTSVSGDVLGYYSQESNQIILFDMEGRNEAAWQENSAVIIHEATHQIAFNTGIHSRCVPTPAWVVEGLATVFEAPGVYDPHNHTRPADRINQGRLESFRKGIAPHHRPEVLTMIVASDELFRADPGFAYAEAWALTHFLIETQPKRYIEYLKRTAARPPFKESTEAERKADFTAVFGSDWRMFEARFMRFMSGVK